MFIRKALMPVGALGLLSVLFFGRDAASYLGTSVGWIKSSVKECVPVEFELKRARDMVGNLVPDIRRNMHVIATEEVEVEKLEKQIGESTQTLTSDRADILKLKSDLSGGGTSLQNGGRSYSVEEVKQDLCNRFERYKTHDSTLKSLRDIQSARQKSLQAARKKLESMLAAKRKLEVDVENLEARLKMIEVAQTTSDYNFDDSQLSRAKDLIADIRTRLNVDEKLVNAETRFNDQIPVGEAPSQNIVEQVGTYFDPSPAKSGSNKNVAEKADKVVSVEPKAQK